MKTAGSVPLRLMRTPQILRRWQAVPTGHTYVGDQHLLDYQAVLPDSGEIVNFQFYLWIDAASTYWAGLAGTYGPYTRYTVGESFLRACRLHIPDAWLLNDNGKQEKSQYFDDLVARVNRVITRHYTTPNVPPVKPVEAQMAVLTRYLNQEGIHGYRKRSDDPFTNKRRQADLQEAKAAGNLPTVPELLDAIARVVERHNTQPCRSEVEQCDYVPAERFWRGLDGRRIVLPEADLKGLFYPRFQRKVRNACIRLTLGGQVVEFTAPELAYLGPQEPVQILANPLPPHDGGLVLRQAKGDEWEPYCTVQPWLGRGLNPLTDSDRLSTCMRQKNRYLQQFRDALTAVHNAARQLAGVAEPAAKVVRLSDVVPLRAALAETPEDRQRREKAPVLDHQAALRALVNARKPAGS